MSLYTLENDVIKVKIDSFGAELKSLVKKETNKEYMWNADPAYWKRTSPVLFPLVGSLNNKQYTFEGVSYPMSQHGFARDMEFEVCEVKADQVWFVLNSNEETRKAYPFDFELKLGYVLKENAVEIHWQVKNPADCTMYFSIGGHPAFLCPIEAGTVQSDYFLAFDDKKSVVSSVIGRDGLLSENKKTYELEKGVLAITDDLFDDDALIIEQNQAHRVALLTKEKKPYLTVSFDAPLFGIWSPPHKNAPFICIEPWYGRCDKEEFHGNLEEREWGNKLEAGEIFDVYYTVEIDA